MAQWLLLTLLALNPYVILFSATLLSEFWFTALLRAALLLVEKAAKTETPVAWAVAAALLGGLAYLTRSAGIVLLASGVAVPVAARIGARKALAFRRGRCSPSSPAGCCGRACIRLHTDDVSLVYYTDYFRYEIYNVSIKTLHLFLWKNLDGLVSSLGYLVLPNVTSSLFMKILAEVIGVAMISGIVRMVTQAGRRRALSRSSPPGAAFMLVIWHFPPNERFVLPLVPLAFAGLLTEMEHFVGMARAGLKHREASQRVAAVVMLALRGAGVRRRLRASGLRRRSVSGRDRAPAAHRATSTIAAPTPGFAPTCRRTPR